MYLQLEFVGNAVEFAAKNGFYNLCMDFIKPQTLFQTV